MRGGLRTRAATVLAAVAAILALGAAYSAAPAYATGDQPDELMLWYCGPASEGTCADTERNQCAAPESAPIFDCIAVTDADFAALATQPKKVDPWMGWDYATFDVPFDADHVFRLHVIAIDADALGQGDPITVCLDAAGGSSVPQVYGADDSAETCKFYSGSTFDTKVPAATKLASSPASPCGNCAGWLPYDPQYDSTTTLQPGWIDGDGNVVPDTGGGGSVVSLSPDDQHRLDLTWWGIWASVGLSLVSLIAPRWFRSWGFEEKI